MQLGLVMWLTPSSRRTWRERFFGKWIRGIFAPSPEHTCHLSLNRILPVLAVLFLCSFIDRTNVGNAKILGLERDLGMNDHQYAIGLCSFYATYIAR